MGHDQTAGHYLVKEITPRVASYGRYLAHMTQSYDKYFLAHQW